MTAKPDPAVGSGRASHDIVIRGGMIYDGSGSSPQEGDVAVEGDRIVAVGPAGRVRGVLEIDARGLAVAPGFINVLSHAHEALLEDGRSQSDLRQGVTLEIFGEGDSMGPLSPALREIRLAELGDIRYDITWSTLDGFLSQLEANGVSPNVASFVGATTVREHVLGFGDRRARPSELHAMRELVREAMHDGALGVGSSLIYAPATFADTDELVALASEVAPYDGVYISHVRNESEQLVEAVDELIEIAERSGVRAEVYHLKAVGTAHFDRIDAAIGRIEAARERGLAITADMYPYAASSTGLDATMPPWLREGGLQAWIARMHDPTARGRAIDEMRGPGVGWENDLWTAGADNILLVGFRSEALKPLTGRTLASVAHERSVSAEEAAMDLVAEDESRVVSVFFSQSEDVVRKVAARPWVSIGSDGGSFSPEGVFLRSQPHPRAYGAFARFLGRFVRDLRITTLEDAVRRLTLLPAIQLGIPGRGLLRRGHYADVVVFDPATIVDNATFEFPHQFAVGVRDVLVNGVPTIRDGEHLGVKPGRVVRSATSRVRPRGRP